MTTYYLFIFILSRQIAYNFFKTGQEKISSYILKECLSSLGVDRESCSILVIDKPGSREIIFSAAARAVDWAHQPSNLYLSNISDALALLNTVAPWINFWRFNSRGELNQDRSLH